MWKQLIGAHSPNSATRLFHTDGVHMSKDFGMNKYYGSVRAAIKRAGDRLRLFILFSSVTMFAQPNALLQQETELQE